MIDELLNSAILPEGSGAFTAFQAFAENVTALGINASKALIDSRRDFPYNDSVAFTPEETVTLELTLDMFFKMCGAMLAKVMAGPTALKEKIRSYFEWVIFWPIRYYINEYKTNPPWVQKTFFKVATTVPTYLGFDGQGSLTPRAFWGYVLLVICLYMCRKSVLVRIVKYYIRAFFSAIFHIFTHSCCRRRVLVNNVSFPTHVGCFPHAGRYYYRFTPAGKVIEVDLEGGKAYRDPDKDNILWKPIKPKAAKPQVVKPGESAVRDIKSNQIPAVLEKGEVQVYRQDQQYHSRAFVLDDVLEMCRHGTHDQEHFVVRGKNVNPGAANGVILDKKRFIYATDAPGAPKWDEEKHTCTRLDAMYCRLTPDEKAMIGVKSLTERDVTRNYESRRTTISYCIDDLGTYITETGYTLESKPEIHNLGLGLCVVHSDYGASAANMKQMPGGEPKFAGRHLGIPVRTLTSYQGIANVFEHADSILATREALGLYTPPFLGSLNTLTARLSEYIKPGESREGKKERAARANQEYLDDLAAEMQRLEDAVIDAQNETIYGEARPNGSAKPFVKSLAKLLVHEPTEEEKLEAQHHAWGMPFPCEGCDTLCGLIPDEKRNYHSARGSAYATPVVEAPAAKQEQPGESALRQRAFHAMLTQTLVDIADEECEFLDILAEEQEHHASAPPTKRLRPCTPPQEGEQIRGVPIVFAASADAALNCVANVYQGQAPGETTLPHCNRHVNLQYCIVHERPDLLQGMRKDTVHPMVPQTRLAPASVQPNRPPPGLTEEFLCEIAPPPPPPLERAEPAAGPFAIGQGDSVCGSTSIADMYDTLDVINDVKWDCLPAEEAPLGGFKPPMTNGPEAALAAPALAAAAGEVRNRKVQMKDMGTSMGSPGHARKSSSVQPTTVTMRLPPAVASPPKSYRPGECAQEGVDFGNTNHFAKNYIQKYAVGRTLDEVCKGWKWLLLANRAGEALKQISYFVEDTSDDAKTRLKELLALPCNQSLRHYVEALAPQWEDPQEQGEKDPDNNIINDREGKPYFKRCGTLEGTKFQKKDKQPKPENDLQKAIRKCAEHYHTHKNAAGDSEPLHGCKNGEYKIPKNTKKNIDASLRAQAKMAVCTPAPLSKEHDEDFDSAVDLTKKKYRAAFAPEQTLKSYLEEGEAGFLKIFLGLEDKSSGVSARYRNKKKLTFVREHTEEVVDMALTRIILLAAAGEDIYDLDPIEQVQLGLADIKDLTLKGEGHSPKKMREERYRFIWIGSLIDLVVQALLHKADNQFHTDLYQDDKLHCAAIGLGHSASGLERLVRAFKAENVAKHNISSDASAFDLSMLGRIIREDGKRRCENNSDSDVGILIERYAHILCSHVVNNNGDLWICLKDGVTSSGQLSTSAQNTFGRCVMAAFGGCIGWVCAGDDLVGDENFDEKKLLKLGVRSRDVEHSYDEADFTSHTIDCETNTAVFGNVEKMLWNLHAKCIDTSTNKERFGGCLYVLRSTPGVLEDLNAICLSYDINCDGYVHETDCVRDLE
jgi:hypothetical protein